ncbi:protein trunk-like [Contarinia nasturtii]|uniref:protein trunk-like n=1 Tax=Contarinia nasturtii TaxID=265458 RepID=UPI0012D4000B|nr:protein trunk-like [Contarinia nasturtii]
MLSRVNISEVAFFLICFIVLNVSIEATTFDMKKSREMGNCEQLPVKVLKRVHGPAFDARYMSIEQPLDNDEFSRFDIMDTVNRKRNIDADRPSFYLTDNHTEVLSNEAAWNIQWDTFEIQINSQSRRKRSLLPIGNEFQDFPISSGNLKQNKRQSHAHSKKSDKTEPWQCEQKIKWIHLGLDYYPSHLKTVKCTEPKCFYKMHECMPRHFAVRLLQRRRGACADASNLKAYGFSGPKYVEVWEWIEVAVNFCCVCAAASINNS